MALLTGAQGKMDLSPPSEDLWIDYSLAAQRAESEYQEQVEATRSRLTAGGASEGDESWNLAMKNLETQYQQRVQSLQASESYQTLERRFAQTQAFANANWELAGFGDSGGPGNISRRAQERLDTAREFQQSQQQSGPLTAETYYESRYGRPDPAAYASPEPEQVQEAPVESPGAQRARRGAAGGTSPWW